MSELLATLPDLWPVSALRQNWLLYASAYAAHIASLALLVGAIAVLDLRLIGAFRSSPVGSLAPPLWKTAATGLVLAILTGFLLFATRPQAYLANPVFLVKMGLLAAGILNALVVHRSRAWQAAMAGHPVAPALKLAAAASLTIWLATIFAGRLIGFFE